jgi:Type II secretion system (T2SS), protein M subtype b
MRRDFTWRKRLILVGVVLLVLADIGLGAYSWELSSAQQSPQKQVAAEVKQRDLLKGDIKRAQNIRDNIPATQKACDGFERSLFPASSGYSTVRAELGETARKSGVRIEDLAFKPTEIANRGVTEVLIDATVDGDYKNVIGFLNGLQRSANLYAVDSLALGSDNANQASSNVIKVALHLRTYFRTAA